MISCVFSQVYVFWTSSRDAARNGCFSHFVNAVCVFFSRAARARAESRQPWQSLPFYCRLFRCLVPWCVLP